MKITGALMRHYFAWSDPIDMTDGNLLITVDYGMITHCGSGMTESPKAHRKYIAASLLAGLALATAIPGRKR
ncbi:hypothetical protein AAFN85_31280 [Mucilaginibacter sp. CAU 1740]|uniref:hypothetical protein n=1 Tax=Mucilaginibacter sp. CAU 1740 TaxID=3140365 RepID=UPI00325B78E8